jgi:hypothetical protein
MYAFVALSQEHTNLFIFPFATDSHRGWGLGEHLQHVSGYHTQTVQFGISAILASKPFNLVAKSG